MQQADLPAGVVGGDTQLLGTLDGRHRADALGGGEAIGDARLGRGERGEVEEHPRDVVFSWQGGGDTAILSEDLYTIHS